MEINDPGWDNLFIEAGRKYDIDPLLLKSIMMVESGAKKDALGRITATSPQGALGPMQLLPSSFPDVNPYDPTEAIPAAAKYLAQGRDEHKGDITQALMYYHGGPNIKQWGPKTHAYPSAVFNLYQQIMPKIEPTTPSNNNATGVIIGQDGNRHELNQQQMDEYYKLSPDFQKQQQYLKNIP